MSPKLRQFVIIVAALFTFGCGGCADSSTDGGDGSEQQSEEKFTAPDGAQCTEATPCGDCDQDCRGYGNPFAGGGGSGGDGTGEPGTGAGAGGDAPGSGSGGGGTGYDGETCDIHSDCRGLCGDLGTCEGFGGGGYNGDSCQSSRDCRGECGGDGICVGSGTDPGGDLGGGGSGSGGDGSGGGAGDGGPGGEGSGAGDGGYDPTVCSDLLIDLDYAIPTITLLIDQSSSMYERFGGGMDRWEAAYYSLMDPDAGIVNKIDGAFRVGLSLYSSRNGGPDCPLLADVRPELNNYSAIDRVFSQAEPIEDTPTGEAILGTLRQFEVHQDQGRKILLLATDGEPDTCAVPDPQRGQGDSIAAAEHAYTQGIETFVLSVGDEVGRPHLEELANAGVGLPAGGMQQAPYYTANDPDQLATQLDSIVDLARSCIFRLRGGIVDPGLLDRSTITVDGVAIPYNDPDGWTYHQNRKTCHGSKQCIELQGAACAAIQDGQPHQITGDFLCTYYDPENPPVGSGSDGGGHIPGSSGSGGGDGGGGGSGSGGGSTECVPNNSSCSYDGDCCSGICSSSVNGMCVVN